ncbi:hypothetical protein Syun_030461 [Stephania yunnanensis]|uniref:Purple acid phosphatase n=1 Tax=Stephania yunnanensis TaxID=152371 RepID=A0AAP0EC09_9MAGN
MDSSSYRIPSLISLLAVVAAAALLVVDGGAIPSTDQGPFRPVTVPVELGFRGNAVDLPESDPRVQRKVMGMGAEQISVSLSVNYDSVWISWVTGLKPGTVYYYRCGDPSIAAMSDIHFFKTMPISSPKKLPKKNCRGADCYSCSFPQTPIHETYQPRWDFWGRYMQPLISKVPIMVVEGNHELELQAENKSFVSYSSRFAFPSEESGSPSTFFYSFNAGGIHFIMLGAYIDYKKTGAQYKWLKRDLADVDRSVTPWLVATWHAPWYSTYKAHYREAECMKVEMEELLYSYGVDLVFNGHVHAYERSNRVYNYSLDPCGPVYITVGDGGNREKMAINHADEPGQCPDPLSTPDEIMGGFCAYNFTSGPANGQFCWDRQPDYSAYRESSFGHGILEVKNDTHALWTWHRNQDLYKTPGDQIYIVREPDRCFAPRRVVKARKYLY